MSPLYIKLRDSLVPHYGLREAQAIALLVLETAFGLSRTDVYADKVRHFSEEENRRWLNISQRLAVGEPVQYVLGLASFYGMSFHVTPATLIPRPETEELVTIAKSLARKCARILDAGTGSGCIAISLAQHLPEADVEAWDISPEALEVAKKNARKNGVNVRFVQRDMLKTEHPSDRFDLIVSNPPYIRESERAEMASHVLEHEPPTALFVPDEDALRFYRALGHLALCTLSPGGYLCVEINAALGKETALLFSGAGLEEVRIIKDAFGRDRFLTARFPTKEN